MDSGSSAGRFRRLSRTVLVVGWVSLFTDVSSEMIVPILLLFLTTVMIAGYGFPIW